MDLLGSRLPTTTCSLNTIKLCDKLPKRNSKFIPLRAESPGNKLESHVSRTSDGFIVAKGNDDDELSPSSKAINDHRRSRQLSKQKPCLKLLVSNAKHTQINEPYVARLRSPSYAFREQSHKLFFVEIGWLGARRPNKTQQLRKPSCV